MRWLLYLVTVGLVMAAIGSALFVAVSDDGNFFAVLMTGLLGVGGIVMMQAAVIAMGVFLGLREFSGAQQPTNESADSSLRTESQT